MLRGIWVRLLIVLGTIFIIGPAMLVVLLVPRRSDLLLRAGRMWSRMLLAASGIELVCHGLERAASANPCIYIANHQSIVDIWVMFEFIPDSTRFVAKQELFRVPIFGWALAASGCVPIDRGNRNRAIRSLRLAAERIRGGQSVILYPEGSRSLDGSLQPFKRGAFHLALEAEVPIVPVAILGSFEAFPPRSLRVTPGRVDVFIEPHVDPARYRPNDHRGLLDEVRGAIARRFAGHRAA